MKMSKKICAELSFEDNNGNKYRFLIKDYQGYTYENKTHNLKFCIDDKFCICRDIKFDTLKEKIKN